MARQEDFISRVFHTPIPRRNVAIGLAAAAGAAMLPGDRRTPQPVSLAEATGIECKYGDLGKIPPNQPFQNLVYPSNIDGSPVKLTSGVAFSYGDSNQWAKNASSSTRRLSIQFDRQISGSGPAAQFSYDIDANRDQNIKYGAYDSLFAVTKAKFANGDGTSSSHPDRLVPVTIEDLADIKFPRVIGTFSVITDGLFTLFVMPYAQSFRFRAIINDHDVDEVTSHYMLNKYQAAERDARPAAGQPMVDLSNRFATPKPIDCATTIPPTTYPPTHSTTLFSIPNGTVTFP